MHSRAAASNSEGLTGFISVCLGSMLPASILGR
jgi:hypothetical protein